ncbi:TerC family protein [Polaribacter aestuariivivens]|uniref:TerC family protein n=1 Tax=Polaribacter aestuariivivens TaxID=2304626 RepID=A0A5S3N7T7_9FLAO|nr:TerC family protein [Polaribacter aestuariivivens]TMM31415.1 TerC family protein [Polaribacter aestuariivivens]
MEIFAHADTWVALLTLTFLEIILGIDNIIFISISANKLPENQVKKATILGLALAMVTRIILLFGVSYLIALKDPFFEINIGWFTTGLTGQSIILFLGGLFLLYKSTKEIREKMEGTNEDEVLKAPKKISFTNVIIQIILIDIVFSFDSILTAVGMTNGVDGALIIMVIAVIVSILIMMLFANPISSFVNRNPTIQMLALSFLILIGFMLITEGAHLSHTEIFNKTVGAIPKGYLYFAIAFSLGVEMLNLRIRKKK